MHAHSPVDQADRLTRAHHNSRIALWGLAGLLGAFACVFFPLRLADDDLLPAPLNVIVFILLTGGALALLVVHMTVGVRLDQVGIASQFASALAANPPVSGLDVARLYATVAKMTGQVVELRAELSEHLDDTREVLPLPVPARGIVTVVQGPAQPTPLRRSRRPRKPRAGGAAATATVTRLLPDADVKYLSDAADIYELGRQVGKAERDDGPPES